MNIITTARTTIAVMVNAVNTFHFELPNQMSCRHPRLCCFVLPRIEFVIVVAVPLFSQIGNILVANHLP